MVNTAARLQSVATPGTVLVGEATRIAAEPALEFVAAGDQELKGKASPVPAWRAIRVVGERGGARRPDALEPPFVGRTDELRFLKEQFHATGREQRARLVSLVGQAGIGKSRLAWELEKYLDGVVEQVWWHRGRSPSYGEGVTFWALGEMIRRRANLTEGDDEEATRAAIAAMVEQHITDETERAWIEPRILVLLGIGEIARRRTDGALRRLADLLRTTRRDRHRRVRRRGPPVVGRRPARLPRAPPRLGPLEPDLRADARPPGAPRTATGLGHGSPGRDRDASRSAADAAMRELLEGIAPDLPDPSSPGSWSGPTGCRCMPSRRSGCSSRPGGWLSRTAGS